MAEKWKKGLRSVGGETAGQVVQITEGIFHDYTVGDNADAFYIDYDDVPFAEDPLYIETRASQETNKLLAKFEIKAGGVVTGYLGIRYSYVKGVNAQGRLYLSISADVGIMDENDNFTMQNTTGDCSLSIGGTSFYTFRAAIYICVGSQNNRTVFGLAVQNHEYAISNDYEARCVLTSRDYVQGLIKPEKSYSPEFGWKSQPGGYGYGGIYGTHDYHSDHSGIPTKPQYGFTSAGFLNHYLITSQGLEQLGEALFPSPTGSSADTTDAIDRLTAIMWNSKIIDYVVDCRIIPVYPHDDGLHNITCGGKVLVHPGTGAIYRAALIDEDFVDVDCGTITTPITEGNFLDFYQMSCKLFLPFYGFVDIAPEYWNGATIGVYYRFNMMDGSFMVWVTSKAYSSDMNDDDVIAQYAGNACIHLPVNSQSYSQLISGMITTGAAIVGAATGAGVAGLAGEAGGMSALGGAVASGAANIINSRPQLNANNSYNGSAALMSKRTPYLLIEFNQAQFSSTYVDEKGLPLVDDVLLSSLSGMTVCSNPVINFACADEEADEIRSLLASGVIL